MTWRAGPAYFPGEARQRVSPFFVSPLPRRVFRDTMP